MPGSAPWELVSAVRDGTAAGVFEVEDPVAVAVELAAEPDVSAVAGQDLPAALAAARVGLARVLVDRARRFEEQAPPGAPSGSGAGLHDGPAVRAAEAHLRRQEAAWKLAWWERAEPVPALDGWAPAGGSGPVTLVVVDADRSIDEGADATRTATGGAAVRLVVLRPRAGTGG